MISKSTSEIDHAAHGWALLAFRLPEIRPFARHSEVRTAVSEMCANYSITVLNTRKLRIVKSDSGSVEHYEALLLEIENEVGFFVREFAHQSV